uniref:Uncharacterized protein n=1 Tax=Arundo donax TaxID=35708 RepID=A0A0A9F1U2_ARUDO
MLAGERRRFRRDTRATGVVSWGGAPIVMPRRCRLRLNLVNKYRASGVVCDLVVFVSVDPLLPHAYISNKWYQELWLDWIWRRCAKDHRGGARIMLDGRRETARYGARWSMAAIGDSIGGIGHSRQATWTVRWAAIGRDRPSVVISPIKCP